MIRTSTGLRTAATALALAGALIGSGLIADQSQAKTKNPLAGRWTGMTGVTPTWSGPPAPISFQITNAGYVVHLATTATLNHCDATAATASVAMPPVRMNKSVPGYPKGKRFDYSGPGVQPSGQLGADGKIISTHKMEGALLLTQVEISPGVICRTGNVHYTVKRAGS